MSQTQMTHAAPFALFSLGPIAFLPAAFFLSALSSCAAEAPVSHHHHGDHDVGLDSSADAQPAGDDCPSGSIVDALESTTVEIGFGGANGSGVFAYAPDCVRVRVGTRVQFVGDFATHPLSPGRAPGEPLENANPIPRTQTGASLGVVFSAPGTFPYICDYHYAGGMRGAVIVVE